MAFAAIWCASDIFEPHPSTPNVGPVSKSLSLRSFGAKKHGRLEVSSVKSMETPLRWSFYSAAGGSRGSTSSRSCLGRERRSEYVRIHCYVLQGFESR